MKASEALTRYLDSLDNHRAERTIDTYRQSIEKFIALVGDVELTRASYALFLDKIKALNKSSQSIYRTAVLGMFAFVADNDNQLDYAGILRDNRRLRERVGRSVISIDLDPINRVIAYCESLVVYADDVIAMRDRALILTLADTGLRISEACNLTRGSLNWREGRALVSGKGNVTDIVRFSERSIKAMQEYFVTRKDGASGKPLSSLPIFARHDDGAGKTIQPITTSGAWHAIKERIKEAGVDPKTIRVHDFRHYFVTLIVIQTGNIKLAQELARHKNISVTQWYAHMDGVADRVYDDVFNQREK